MVFASGSGEHHRNGLAGLTLGCAECHNHKFDPFTQKDYYRFLAFFADEDYHVADDGEDDYFAREAELELPTSEQAAKGKELRTEIVQLEAVLNTPTQHLPQRRPSGNRASRLPSLNGLC